MWILVLAYSMVYGLKIKPRVLTGWDSSGQNPVMVCHGQNPVMSSSGVTLAAYDIWSNGHTSTRDHKCLVSLDQLKDNCKRGHVGPQIISHTFPLLLPPFLPPCKYEFEHSEIFCEDLLDLDR